MIEEHEGDLPADIRFGESVAIDTETMGLNPHRDRLCLVQLAGAEGPAHVVRFAKDARTAPNLSRLLQDPAILKIFHFARFDIAVLKQALAVTVSPVYCTKIASKLTRTYTDRHGLKDLVREIVGVELSKQQQSSDWGGPLSEAQLQYAASDVIYLHTLKKHFDALLAREGRMALARACFGFLPVRAELDLLGWGEDDIFSHS